MGVTQLVEWLPSMRSSLGMASRSTYTSVTARPCNVNIWLIEAGGPGMKDHPQLQQPEDILEYVRPWFNK